MKKTQNFSLKFSRKHSSTASGFCPFFLLFVLSILTLFLWFFYSYFHKLMSSKLRVAEVKLGESLGPILGLKPVQWLGMKAFSQVFLRKKSRYMSLISILFSALGHKMYQEERESPLLAMAIDRKHSQIFEKIHY